MANKRSAEKPERRPRNKCDTLGVWPWRESACLAKRLIESTIRKQEVEPGHLTVHADHGSTQEIRSRGADAVCSEDGETHARPHDPNDNPFSKSQFKTMKYRPEFP